MAAGDDPQKSPVRLIASTPEVDLVDVRAAAERAEAEKDRQRMLEALQWSIRDLTSNLIRIARGAGEPRAVEHQVEYFGEKLTAYREFAEPWQYPDFAGMLDWRRTRDGHDDLAEREAIEEQIIRAALRIVGARLVRGTLQESLGDKDLREAVGQLEEWKSEMRRKRLAEQRAAAPRKPKRRMPAKKPAGKKG